MPPVEDRQHLVLLSSTDEVGTTLLLPDGLVALPGEVIHINGQPVAHYDAVIDNLVVPAVGKYVRTPRNGLPGYVLDPQGNEVTLLTRGMRLAGKSTRTADAYLNGLLTFCRFCWAVGIDVETITSYQYLVFRRWLMHCIRLPKQPKAAPPRRRKGPKRRNLQSGQSPKPRGIRQPNADITGHMATATARSVEAAVRCVYRQITTAGLIPGNPIPDAAHNAMFSNRSPLEAVPRLRVTNAPAGTVPPLPVNKAKNIDVLPERAQKRLLEATYLRDRVLFQLCLESGVRAREALSICPEDVNFDEGEVSVVAKGQNGAQRQAPVTDDWLNTYQQYLEDLHAKGIRLTTGVSIWRNLRSPYTPLTYKGMSDRFHVTLGPLSAGHGLHAIRHTAATYMIRELGMPLHEVQQVLGHADPSTTSKYLHTATREAVVAFRRAMAAPRPTPQPDQFEELPANLMQAIYDIVGEN